MNLSLLSKKYFKLAVKNIKRETPNKITCNCPLCGDKRGRLSITAVKDENGVVGCFNAGCIFAETPMPFVKALDYLAPDLTHLYKQEKFKNNIDFLKNDLNKNSINENSLNDLLERVKSKEKVIKETKIFSVPEKFLKIFKELKSSKKGVEYLNKRKIEIQDDWLFSEKNFVEFEDKKYYVKNAIVIPLWQAGKIKGFYTRSIEEKRFSTIILKGGEKLWISKNFNNNKTVYIFESIFDALSSGLDNVIAMLGADIDNVFLEKLDVVFVFDNDETGYKKTFKFLKNHKCFVWPANIYDKDINKLLETKTKEEIKDIILNNIFKGLEGIIRLNLRNN